VLDESVFTWLQRGRCRLPLLLLLPLTLLPPMLLLSPMLLLLLLLPQPEQPLQVSIDA